MVGDLAVDGIASIYSGDCENHARLIVYDETRRRIWSCGFMYVVD